LEITNEVQDEKLNEETSKWKTKGKSYFLADAHCRRYSGDVKLYFCKRRIFRGEALLIGICFQDRCF